MSYNLGWLQRGARSLLPGSAAHAHRGKRVPKGSGGKPLIAHPSKNSRNTAVSEWSEGACHPNSKHTHHHLYSPQLANSVQSIPKFVSRYYYRPLTDPTTSGRLYFAWEVGVKVLKEFFLKHVNYFTWRLKIKIYTPSHTHTHIHGTPTAPRLNGNSNV